MFQSIFYFTSSVILTPSIRLTIWLLMFTKLSVAKQPCREGIWTPVLQGMNLTSYQTATTLRYASGRDSHTYMLSTTQSTCQPKLKRLPIPPLKHHIIGETNLSLLGEDGFEPPWALSELEDLQSPAFDHSATRPFYITLYKRNRVGFCSPYNNIAFVYYANEDTSLNHRELPYSFLHQPKGPNAHKGLIPLAFTQIIQIILFPPLGIYYQSALSYLQHFLVL